MAEQKKGGRLPRWMKMKMPKGEQYSKVKNLVAHHNLHTICTSGNCPNIGECWNRGTATFMILGDICTRNCRFCNVATGKPLPVDEAEPVRLSKSVNIMGVKHCVITSVDRDDLPDGGSIIWQKTIDEIKKLNPETTLEALIPDFQMQHEALDRIVAAAPEVVSHNIETVERITPQVRSVATYRRSLEVLEYLAKKGMRTKSGIMLGLGEEEHEVLQAMDDLLAVGCKILTIGQYLQPSEKHFPIKDYVSPEVFERYHKIGIEKGFLFVESSPLVRSSYRAEKHVQ